MRRDLRLGITFLVTLPLAAIALPWAAAAPPVVAVHAAKKGAPGSMTFIDADTLAVLGTAPVEGTPWPLGFDRSGASLLVFGGTRADPTSTLQKSKGGFAIVDVRSFASAPVGASRRTPFFHVRDERSERLYVVEADPKAKTRSIEVFDIARLGPPARVAAVERLTSVAVSPDGALLYALCEGKKHKRPKGPGGNLHVLDARTGTEVARLDVGAGAASIAFDSIRGLAYVLGVVDVEGNGKVTVLRAGSVVGQLSLPGRAGALAVGPDGVAYVLVAGSVVALGPDGLTVSRAWRVGFTPSDLVFDAARERFFAGARSGSKIAELDLQTGSVVAVHETGSGARKAGRGFGMALATLTAFAATFVTGVPVFPAGAWGSTATTMALSSYGAFLDVLNPFTDDVSVYDTAKHDVVAIVPTGAGSRRFVRVPDDPNLWIEATGRLVRLDTATNRIDRTVDLVEGIHRATIAWDLPRGRAWIVMGTSIRVLDLRSGEVVGTVDLPSPAFGIWIDPYRNAAAASSRP